MPRPPSRATFDSASTALPAWRRIVRAASAWSSLTNRATDGVVSPALPRRSGASGDGAGLLRRLMELAGLDVDSLARVLLRRHGVTNPEIFGSAARGDDREDSDLDLLVDFSPGTSIIDIIGIRRELQEVLGVPVDLVPRNGLKERVRARAEKDLVPL